MTIFLSSHLLAEVEELCTGSRSSARGRIVYEGALADLHASASPAYRLRTTDDEAAAAICCAAAGVFADASRTATIAFTADEDAVVALSGFSSKPGSASPRSSPRRRRSSSCSSSSPRRRATEPAAAMRADRR